MIDTLENLYKGGRINQVTATLGSILQIKPLILIQSGQVRIVDRVRTRSKALQRLEAMVRDWDPVTEAIVLHTGAQELAQALASSLRDLTPGREMMVGPAGTALASHLGPGAVGACALLAPNRLGGGE
jgi:DegV family protein with EDD domain